VILFYIITYELNQKIYKLPAFQQPMLETLEYGLYVTIVGMGGVFVVLSIIAFFMWSMGKVRLKKQETAETHVGNEISSGELFAIITATYAYHTEQTGVFPVLGSRGWKNSAKMEVLR